MSTPEPTDERKIIITRIIDVAKEVGLKEIDTKFVEVLTNAILARESAIREEAVILKANLAAAMGHMQGCGHPYEYLNKRYPDLAKLVADNIAGPNKGII